MIIQKINYYYNKHKISLGNKSFFDLLHQNHFYIKKYASFQNIETCFTLQILITETGDLKKTRLSSTVLKIEEVKMIKNLYLVKLIIRYTKTGARLSNKNAEVQQ